MYYKVTESVSGCLYLVCNVAIATCGTSIGCVTCCGASRSYYYCLVAVILYSDLGEAYELTTVVTSYDLVTDRYASRVHGSSGGVYVVDRGDLLTAGEDLVANGALGSGSSTGGGAGCVDLIYVNCDRSFNNVRAVVKVCVIAVSNEAGVRGLGSVVCRVEAHELTAGDNDLSRTVSIVRIVAVEHIVSTVVGALTVVLGGEFAALNVGNTVSYGNNGGNADVRAALDGQLTCGGAVTNDECVRVNAVAAVNSTVLNGYLSQYADNGSVSQSSCAQSVGRSACNRDSLFVQIKNDILIDNDGIVYCDVIKQSYDVAALCVCDCIFNSNITGVADVSNDIIVSGQNVYVAILNPLVIVCDRVGIGSTCNGLSELIIVLNNYVAVQNTAIDSGGRVSKVAGSVNGSVRAGDCAAVNDYGSTVVNDSRSEGLVLGCGDGTALHYEGAALGLNAVALSVQLTAANGILKSKGTALNDECVPVSLAVIGTGQLLTVQINGNVLRGSDGLGKNNVCKKRYGVAVLCCLDCFSKRDVIYTTNLNVLDRLQNNLAVYGNGNVVILTLVALLVVPQAVTGNVAGTEACSRGLINRKVDIALNTGIHFDCCLAVNGSGSNEFTAINGNIVGLTCLVRVDQYRLTNGVEGTVVEYNLVCTVGPYVVCICAVLVECTVIEGLGSSVEEYLTVNCTVVVNKVTGVLETGVVYVRIVIEGYVIEGYVCATHILSTDVVKYNTVNHTGNGDVLAGSGKCISACLENNDFVGILCSSECVCEGLIVADYSIIANKCCFKAFNTFLYLRTADNSNFTEVQSCVFINPNEVGGVSSNAGNVNVGCRDFCTCFGLDNDRCLLCSGEGCIFDAQLNLNCIVYILFVDLDTAACRCYGKTVDLDRLSVCLNPNSVSVLGFVDDNIVQLSISLECHSLRCSYVVEFNVATEVEVVAVPRTVVLAAIGDRHVIEDQLSVIVGNNVVPVAVQLVEGKSVTVTVDGDGLGSIAADSKSLPCGDIERCISIKVDNDVLLSLCNFKSFSEGFVAYAIDTSNILAGLYAVSTVAVVSGDVAFCAPCFCHRYGEGTAGDSEGCSVGNFDLTGDSAGSVYIHNRNGVTACGVIVNVECNCIGSDGGRTVKNGSTAVVGKYVENVIGSIDQIYVGKSKVSVVLDQNLNFLAALNRIGRGQSTVLDGYVITLLDLEAQSGGAGGTDSLVEGVSVTTEVDGDILVDDSTCAGVAANELNGVAVISCCNSISKSEVAILFTDHSLDDHGLIVNSNVNAPNDIGEVDNVGQRCAALNGTSVEGCSNISLTEVN